MILETTTNLSKWGHSLALRIPKNLAESARIREGDPLSLSLTKDGSIVIRPARRKYRLDELVSGITAKNRRRETDWGPPVGNEVW